MIQSSVSRCIAEVTNAVLLKMSHHVTFPRTTEEIQKCKLEFITKTAFPGVVGCIDGITDFFFQINKPYLYLITGTHIGIISPKVNNDHSPGLLFYNRKGFYSLNVQIICDANLKILNNNAKYIGSVHDSAVWQTSKARDILKRRYQFQVRLKQNITLPFENHGLDVCTNIDNCIIVQQLQEILW